MSEHPERPAPRGLGAALVAVATLLYMSLWFNNWLGLTTDGWFFFYGDQLAHGRLPYRDFSLLVPPLTVFEAAALVRLFGEHLLVTHAVGVLQRVVFAVVTYLWLAKISPRRVAMLAAITMIVVASADIADTIFSYHFEAALWALLAGYAAAQSLASAESTSDRRAAGRAFVLCAVLAGACAAGSALTKQTTGLLATGAIAVATAALLWQACGRRRALSFLGAYAAGWAVPIAVFAAWLLRHGIGGAFVDALFLRGAAAKGSLAHVLIRPLSAPLVSPSLRVAAILALALLATIALSRRWTELGEAEKRRLALLMGGCATMLAVLAGVYLLPMPRFPRIVAVYVAFFGCLAAILLALVRWRRGGLDASDRQRALFAVVGLVSAYGFALSWPAWEMMAAPGLALLVAAGMSWEEAPAATRAAIAGLCFALIAFSTSSKLASPYIWGEWAEPPVRMATVRSANPVLAGFRLSPATNSFVETLTALLRERSKPTETVFVFPHMPLLYALAGRQPATFSYAHWFDMTPDHVAQRDAAMLLASPPAVIINYEISATEWAINEREFRGGAASGQRRILEVIRQLGEGVGYERVAELRAPVTGNVVTVWARRPGAPNP